jgi:flagellar protein FliO/FliZ
MVTVILALAILGLVAVNTNQTSADLIHQSDAEKNSAGETATTPPETTGSTFYSLIRMVSALVIVIGCIYGGIFLLKRASGSRTSGSSKNKALEVLETAYVAPKKTVSLIRVADKSVLIGVTENGMSVLTELDSSQTAELIPSGNEVQTPASFGSVFRKVSERVSDFRFKRPQAAANS